MRMMSVMECEYVGADNFNADIDIKSICAAVLHSAILDFFSLGAFMKSSSEILCKNEINKARWHAWKWLFDCGEDDSAFSFLWVCQALNLNPDYIREGLTHHHERVFNNCSRNLPAN